MAQFVLSFPAVCRMSQSVKIGMSYRHFMPKAALRQTSVVRAPSFAQFRSRAERSSGSLVYEQVKFIKDSKTALGPGQQNTVDTAKQSTVNGQALLKIPVFEVLA